MAKGSLLPQGSEGFLLPLLEVLKSQLRATERGWEKGFKQEWEQHGWIWGSGWESRFGRFFILAFWNRENDILQRCI
mgnify:CR=1 FL=1